MKTEAVIWDFDGVILDNELLHLDAEMETARAFGIPLTREIALEYLGVRLEDYFRSLLERLGGSAAPPDAAETSDMSAPLRSERGVRGPHRPSGGRGAGTRGSERLSAMLAAHYETLRRYYREVFPLTPHARSVLKRLARRCPMGVATNRERELLDLSFARHRLGRYFSCVVCAEDVCRGKPDPEPYTAAARLLSADPRSCTAVEDTESGFRAAKAAGMTVIARKAAHNAHLDFSPADFVIEDLREIPRLLEGFEIRPARRPAGRTPR